MGWFLSSSKSTKKSKRGGKRASARRSATDPKPWDPQRTFRALKISGYLAAAVGVILGWVYLEDALVRYASAKHAGAVTPAAVVLDDRPVWMSDTVAEQIATLVGDHVGHDPLDVAALRGSVAQLEADPWVRSVTQVRRGADGRIHVQATYREPVAVLETPAGYVLIDEQAIRLPGLYKRYQLQYLAPPEITGVHATAPIIGSKWKGQDLQAGLDLVALLQDQPYFGQIDAVDVQQRDERDRIILSMFAGRREIVWGFAPGLHSAIEPADDTLKLRRLAQLADQPGGLTGDTRVAELNVAGGIRLHRANLEHAAAPSDTP